MGGNSSLGEGWEVILFGVLNLIAERRRRPLQKLRPKNAFVFGISALKLPVAAAHELEGFHRLNLVDLRAIDEVLERSEYGIYGLPIKYHDFHFICLYK